MGVWQPVVETEQEEAKTEEAAERTEREAEKTGGEVGRPGEWWGWEAQERWLGRWMEPGQQRRQLWCISRQRKKRNVAPCFVLVW